VGGREAENNQYEGKKVLSQHLPGSTDDLQEAQL